MHLAAVGVEDVFRIDQLAACLLAVPLGISALTGARKLRTDAVVWWLAALLGLNLLSSLLYSPALSYSLLQCANLASAANVLLEKASLRMHRSRPMMAWPSSPRSGYNRNR